jgi:hypothetical protein
MPSASLKTYSNMLRPTVNHMVQGEIVSIERSIERLAKMNAELGGMAEGYRFRGKLYSHRAPFELRGLHLKPIHQDLSSKAAAIENRLQRVKSSGKALLQGLTVVVTRCSTPQHLRDALPDCIVRRLGDLSELPRMDQEGWCVREEPRLHGQFQQTVDIALRFEADRLLHS